MHVRDHNGNLNGCTGSYTQDFDQPSNGPAWSVNFNKGCPLDDVRESSFIINTNGPFGNVAPLRMYVR